MLQSKKFCIRRKAMLRAFLDEKIEAFKSPKLFKIKNLAEKVFVKWLIPITVAIPIALAVIVKLLCPSFFEFLGSFIGLTTIVMCSAILEYGLLSMVEKHLKTEISLLDKERYAQLFNEVKNEKVCLENLVIIKSLLELKKIKYLNLDKVKYYQNLLEQTFYNDEDKKEIYNMLFLSQNEEFISLIEDIGEKNQEELKEYLKERLVEKIIQQINAEQEKANLLNIEIDKKALHELKDLFQKPKHHSVSVGL
jgi:hypothetical protein